MFTILWKSKVSFFVKTGPIYIFIYFNGTLQTFLEYILSKYVGKL